MSKKDYELIAAIMRDDSSPTLGHWQAQQYRAELAAAFAAAFKAENPRFDRSRFISACKGEDSTDSAGRKVRYS